MLHLLRQALNPALRLKECVEEWPTISRMLREPPRKRGLKIEGIMSLLS